MNKGPNSDSETVLSPKTEWVHQVHSLTSQHAQVCPGTRAGVVSWARPGRVVALRPAVSQRRWPCRGRVPRAWMAVSWPRSRHNGPTSCPSWSQYTTGYCNTNSTTARPLMSLYNGCIVTHSSPSLPSLRSQYDFLYCDTLSQPSSHCYHDTMPCIMT